MSEEYLKNAQDLTKSQKHELITESLSNMDPRDASAFKNGCNVIMCDKSLMGFNVLKGPIFRTLLYILTSVLILLSH